MEVADSTDTLIPIYQSTWHNIAEYRDPNTRIQRSETKLKGNIQHVLEHFMLDNVINVTTSLVTICEPNV